MKHLKVCSDFLVIIFNFLAISYLRFLKVHNENNDILNRARLTLLISGLQTRQIFWFRQMPAQSTASVFEDYRFESVAGFRYRGLIVNEDFNEK